MAETIKIDGKEYSLEGASEQAQALWQRLQFADAKLRERKSMQAVLGRAKNSYLADLKQEIVAKRGGLVFDD